MLLVFGVFFTSHFFLEVGAHVVNKRDVDYKLDMAMLKLKTKCRLCVIPCAPLALPLWMSSILFSSCLAIVDKLYLMLFLPCHCGWALHCAPLALPLWRNSTFSSCPAFVDELYLMLFLPCHCGWALTWALLALPWSTKSTTHNKQLPPWSELGKAISANRQWKLWL